MNTTYKLLLSLIISQLTTVYSQNFENNTDEQALNNIYFSTNLDKNSNSLDYSEISGSPYEKEVFQLGKAVKTSTNSSRSYFLRYNILSDEIEIKTNSSDQSSQSLLKSTDIYAIINNAEYHYLTYNNKKGYFKMIYKGGYYRLYIKQTQTLRDKEPPKNGFDQGAPAKLVDYKKYYYVKDKILTPISKNKKNLFHEFSDYENELKKYMKKEKLNLKKERDLIRIFAYLDSLLE